MTETVHVANIKIIFLHSSPLNSFKRSLFFSEYAIYKYYNFLRRDVEKRCSRIKEVKVNRNFTLVLCIYMKRSLLS